MYLLGGDPKMKESEELKKLLSSGSRYVDLLTIEKIVGLLITLLGLIGLGYGVKALFSELTSLMELISRF